MSQPNYRNDLIAYRIRAKYPDRSKEDVAAISKAARVQVCAQTIDRIIKGQNVSVNKLRTFTDSLDLEWEHVFNPRLTERQFHRAVTNEKAKR